MSLSLVFTIVVLCGLAQSAPQFPGAYRPAYSGGPFVPILSQRFDLNPDGSYIFGYRSGDGSARDENGALRNRGSALEAMAVQGSYSYNSPAGPVSVSYVADENGYQPAGPGIHPSILQAVAQQVAEARANPSGQYYQQPYRQY